ncbi:MAG: CopD family protein [Alphaproteobacteria bacterium]|nr:CopD family protein [Alphaproteobacteria bacterium]
MSIDPDVLTAALRVFVYLGTILTAGSVLFAFTFPHAVRHIERVLARQVQLGTALVVFAEPVRYLLFQHAISGGDWSLAFSPDMRWMALEMPNGQAALLRIVGVLLVLLAAVKKSVMAALGAVLAMTSYALEGHTAGTSQPLLVGAALFAHVASVHWWLGALWPLAALTVNASTQDTAETVDLFGRFAMPVVALVIVAGVFVLGMLVGWRVETTDGYQRLFFAKLAGVAIILSLAAYNKLRLTPMIEERPNVATARLRQSIRLEWVFAFLVLVLTGFVTTTTPGMSQ